jgi:hypothetical protein
MNFSCNRRSSVSLASLELNLQNICSLYGSLVLYINFNNQAFSAHRNFWSHDLWTTKISVINT